MRPRRVEPLAALGVDTVTVEVRYLLVTMIEAARQRSNTYIDVCLDFA